MGIRISQIMLKVNPHYARIKREFIFPVIEKKLEVVRAENPGKHVVNLGIGDVIKPLGKTAGDAIVEAVQEMTDKAIGYGPPQGYSFLRDALVESEYGRYGIGADEIFISEGTKGDSVYLQEIFCRSGRAAVTDPTYPSYVDGCLMEGRDAMVYMPCTEENEFSPQLPNERVALIYLCSPNNPTGVAINREKLKMFVDYANENGCVILFDAAYVDFIRSADVPRSIYEIEGAKRCAIEMRSFSKSAGFTGVRCAYSVVPKELLDGEALKLWMMRQNTKFNGVSYPVQRGALATLSAEGREESRAAVDHYMEQAGRLRKGVLECGFEVYGGVDCPYLWWKAPRGMGSWKFFDLLLEKCLLMSIPGVSFGPCGEGFVRLSGFASSEDVKEALCRISSL